MEKKFPIAHVSSDRRLRHCDASQSYLSGERGGFFDHPLLNGHVADDPALADFRPARLELRFYQGDDIGTRSEEGRDARKNVAQRDE